MIRKVKEIDLSNDAIGSAAYAQVGEDIILGFRYDRLTVQVNNVSAATGDDLASFVLQSKPHPKSEWMDCTGGNGITWTGVSLVHYSIPVTPETLAKGAITQLHSYTGLLYAIRFIAKAATGKTVKLKINGVVYKTQGH